MKNAIIFLLILFIPFGVWAQSSSGSVSGTVKVSEGEALSYANVRIVSKQDASKVYGTATDDKGMFSIKVPIGLYSLEISFVGYEKYESTVQVNGNVKLPVIALGSNAEQLNEVVITAKTITYNATGYIAEISKNPLYKDYELDNILKMTPGTYISPLGDVTAYGKNISKIYVNNREVRLTRDALVEYLKNFNGKNIKTMEVIANSGVEDDASSAGSSIIKITTTRTDDGGMLTAIGE